MIDVKSLTRKEHQELEWQTMFDGEDSGDPVPHITRDGKILWFDLDTLRVIGYRHIVFLAGEYPAISIAGKYIKISHIVAGKPLKGFVVDHINRNTYDSRRANLRIVTPAENARNTSRVFEYIPNELEVRMKNTEDYFRAVVIQCQPKQNKVKQM